MTPTETRRDKRSIAVAVQDSHTTLIAGCSCMANPGPCQRPQGVGVCPSSAGCFESPIEWSLRLPWVMLKVFAH